MNFPPYETSPELLAALERTKGYVMSPREYFEQKVSFVYGNSPASETMTKRQVRAMIPEAAAWDEVDALRAAITVKDRRVAELEAALRVADDAIKERIHYYDSVVRDTKPERAQLRKAGYTIRAALAGSAGK